MWSTALSLLASLVDTKYFKAALIALGCAFSAWVAYSYQSHKYEAQIADIKAQMAIQVAQQEKENAQKLSKAIEERDLANARLDSLNRSNADLLKRLSDSNNRESERASEYSQNALIERYAGCRRLLVRGSELAERGSRMVQQYATDYKALSDIVK